MNNSTIARFVSAVLAVMITTMSFAEVSSIRSVDFEYDHPVHSVVQA